MGIFTFAKKKEQKAAEAAHAAEKDRTRRLTSDTSSHNPYAQVNLGPWGDAKRAYVEQKAQRQTDEPEPSAPAYPSTNSSSSRAYGENAYGNQPMPPNPTPKSHGYGGFSGDPNVVPGHGASFTLSFQPLEQPPPYDDYSTYDDLPPGEERQLTAEEEEEEDVASTKQEIRFLKKETVANSRKALAIADEMNSTGQNTLVNLGIQGESLDQTDMNLNKAIIENRLAKDQTRELDRYNRSMFANLAPRPTRHRQEKEINKMVQQHQADRREREESRAFAYQKGRSMETHMRQIDSVEPGDAKKRGIERAKYQFEADSEDEKDEDEIDDNFRILGGAVSRAKVTAEATGKELEMQNKQLGVITGKVRISLLNLIWHLSRLF